MRYPKPIHILFISLSMLAVILLAKKTFACEVTPTVSITPTITDTPSVTVTISPTSVTSTPTPGVTITPTDTPIPTKSITIQASTQNTTSKEDMTTQSDHIATQGTSQDLSNGISSSSLTDVFNNVLPTITNPNIKRLNENYTSTSLSKQVQDSSTNITISSQTPLSNQKAANTISSLPTNISQPASPIVTILNQVGNSTTFEYFSTESQSINFKAITRLKINYIVNGVKYFINAISIHTAHTKSQNTINVSKDNNSLKVNIQTSLTSVYNSFTHIHLMAHALQ